MPVVRLLLVAVLIADFTGCGGRSGEPTNGLVGDTSRGSVRIPFGDTSQSSGSVTVQSLVSLRATFSWDAVTLVPRARDVDAMGTFTMSGTVTIANINNVCGLCPD